MAKRMTITAAERKEIEAWVKEEVEKGRPLIAIARRAKTKYGAIDWKTLLALIIQILSMLLK